MSKYHILSQEFCYSHLNISLTQNILIMSYSHRTNQSFSPDLEFWRLIEILISTFPYKQGNTEYLTKEEFIRYYETRYNERFDVDYSDRGIDGKLLSRSYILVRPQRRYLDEMPAMERRLIAPDKILKQKNPNGRILKFLSNAISDSDKVYKFQHFFESVYYYLMDINNLNPDLPIIRQNGLENRSRPDFSTKWERYKSINGGLMELSDLINNFNEICRVHSVPFVMFTFKQECYVVHTTDIFIEKLIQDLPLFLSDPDLSEANTFFIKAYTLRDEGNFKDSLAKTREGIEVVRDYIYTRYGLTKSTSVHKDFRELFDTHSTIAFDFTKIPEDDSTKLNKIIEYLKDSILLVVKMGNFGHHTLTRPHLLEENTSIFALGLISSTIPYILYLLR